MPGPLTLEARMSAYSGDSAPRTGLEYIALGAIWTGVVLFGVILFVLWKVFA